MQNKKIVIMSKYTQCMIDQILRIVFGYCWLDIVYNGELVVMFQNIYSYLNSYIVICIHSIYTIRNKIILRYDGSKRNACLV